MNLLNVSTILKELPVLIEFVLVISGNAVTVFNKKGFSSRLIIIYMSQVRRLSGQYSIALNDKYRY